jgi:hypothetical protein
MKGTQGWFPFFFAHIKIQERIDGSPILSIEKGSFEPFKIFIHGQAKSGLV